MKAPAQANDLFAGRTVTIATMHGKERVLAPLLEKELHVRCKVVEGLNTDAFGSFSGEIQRKGTPIEALRAKTRKAIELVKGSLVVASEGSFGPHPSYFFIPGNEEMVMLTDTVHKLEIVGRHLTEKTNYQKREIKSLPEFESFAKQIGAPEHGIILKTIHGPQKVWKDFTSFEDTSNMVEHLLKKERVLMAETDMRAMNNPTRMKAIEQATLDLVKNIKLCCPKCKAPGFSIQGVQRGLPCEHCGMPTKSVKAHVHSCQKCGFTETRSNQRTYENPQYCDYCNP